MEKNTIKSPDAHFQDMVKIVLYTAMKAHLAKYYSLMTLDEKIALLKWTNTTTSEQLFRYIRNHAENLSR